MKLLRWSVIACLSLLSTTSSASASVIQIGIGAFGAGSTLLTFSGLADGTEVNGLTAGGILFQYSLGNGQLIIDGGPGVTNNISPPNVVAIGSTTGVLTLALPSLVDTFGLGFAVLNGNNVPNAITLSLFNGASAVGSLSYNGVPDPVFAGGFAGIQSTDPFNRVQLTFNSALAPSFAVDNIRTQLSVPEPATLLLFGTGIVMMARRARRGTR